MTAMSVCTPSSLPRSMVTVRDPGAGLPAMTRAANVGAATLRWSFRASSSAFELLATACSC
jgi:hypothetical protein